MNNCDEHQRTLEFHKAYLDMAHRWGQMSRAERLKVGCLIVKDGSIVSDGFNGTPAGLDNTCEYDTWLHGVPVQVTRPEVVHAEANAVAKLASSSASGAGGTLYCHYSSCIDCAKLLIQSRIERVVFRELYRDQAGLDLFRQAGVEILHIDNE